MKQQHHSIAARFAKALDEEDYAVALSCLSADCAYTIRGERHIGPEAIVDSYRGNGDEAARKFDRIEYGSEIRSGEDEWIIIAFWDRITHRGDVLLHRCEQWVRVGDRGLITRIEHHDLPGESERLASFKARVGL